MATATQPQPTRAARATAASIAPPSRRSRRLWPLAGLGLGAFRLTTAPLPRRWA